MSIDVDRAIWTVDFVTQSPESKRTIVCLKSPEDDEVPGYMSWDYDMPPSQVQDKVGDCFVVTIRKVEP